jgi:hypothetical protein
MPARAPIPVFDVGNVLIRWDPRNLYRKLIPDEAARGFGMQGHHFRGAVALHAALEEAGLLPGPGRA